MTSSVRWCKDGEWGEVVLDSPRIAQEFRVALRNRVRPEIIITTNDIGGTDGESLRDKPGDS